MVTIQKKKKCFPIENSQASSNEKYVEVPALSKRDLNPITQSTTKQSSGLESKAETCQYLLFLATALQTQGTEFGTQNKEKMLVDEAFLGDLQQHL
uniref:Uncharacterized protein n=1 Tax=Romanomermis culicivorax TaxID=13658 RepID=A0A915KZQ4_ROMCU